MRNLMAAAMLCVAVAAVASGTTYHDGDVHDGYTYRSADGYWHLGGKAYYRVSEPYTYAYTNCYGQCYNTTAYRYKYYEYVPPVAYKAPVVEYAPGWETKLLEIAAARDQIEGKMRLQAMDHARYMQAVTALGLQGNFRFDQYGLNVQYPSYYQGNQAGNYNLGSYGVNAATIYGHAAEKITDLFGDDTAELFLQSAQLGQSAQKYGAQATSEFNGLLQLQGDNRARVASILAKGRAASDALRAAEGSSVHLESKTSTFGSQPGSVPQGALPSTAATEGRGEDEKRVLALMQSRCASCHDGKEEGNFDAMNYFRFEPAFRAKIWDRVNHADPDKLMPRGKNGKGVRLSKEDRSLLLPD